MGGEGGCGERGDNGVEGGGFGIVAETKASAEMLQEKMERSRLEVN